MGTHRFMARTGLGGVVSYYTATHQFGLTGQSRSWVSSFPQLFFSLNETQRSFLRRSVRQQAPRNYHLLCHKAILLLYFHPLKYNIPDRHSSIFSRLAWQPVSPLFPKTGLGFHVVITPPRNRRHLMSWQRLDISMPLVTEEVSTVSNTPSMG